MTRRPRTAICPGCGHPEPLAGGRLTGHYTDGAPMPVTEPDYQRMCPWTFTRPDADRPASAGAVRATHARRPGPPDGGEPARGSVRRAPAGAQLDLLDLIDDATQPPTST